MSMPSATKGLSLVEAERVINGGRRCWRWRWYEGWKARVRRPAWRRSSGVIGGIPAGRIEARDPMSSSASWAVSKCVV